MDGKIHLRCKAKTLPDVVIFFHLNSSKLSHQLFEFSLKVKVMGLNPGYLLKSFLLYLTDDGLLFVKALFRSRLQNTSRWTTQIPGHFSTICFWWIFEHCFGFLGTNFSGPFGTFLFSCITLCYIFTFLILNSFTSYHIVINFMFMISNKRNNKIGRYSRVPNITVGLNKSVGANFSWKLIKK